MPHDKRIPLLFGGALSIALFTLVGCGGSGELPPAPVTMQLTSLAFEDGKIMPHENTCDAAYGDVSPHLAWSGVPSEAKSVAVILNDPATPAGNWVFWMVYGITPNITEIEGGTLDNPDVVPDGARQGKNSFDKNGYDGPCPIDLTTHDYFFKVYALDTEIDLDEGARLRTLTGKMAGHVLAEGHLMGKYVHVSEYGKGIQKTTRPSTSPVPEE